MCVFYLLLKFHTLIPFPSPNALVEMPIGTIERLFISSFALRYLYVCLLFFLCFFLHKQHTVLGVKIEMKIKFSDVKCDDNSRRNGDEAPSYTKILHVIFVNNNSS